MGEKGRSVGIATFPNQAHAEALHNGFEFTLMSVGESGLGKSTFVNSLFKSDVYVDAECPPAGSRHPFTCSIQRTTVNLSEGGSNLRLTVVDAPGFGAAIDSHNCWEPILRDLEAGFEHYLDGEGRIHREKIVDRRVHCCLYFIAPSGRGLKALDIAAMKRLQHRVNLVPVIAKADALTAAECAAMKAKVSEDIQKNDIKIFHFSRDDDDDESVTGDADTQAYPVFAVSASVANITVEGRTMRGRSYPWGFVDGVSLGLISDEAAVDNPLHCDFSRLRDNLLRTHTQELIDATHLTHYDRFRAERMADIAEGGSDSAEVLASSSLVAKMELEKAQHEERLAKVELEMSQVFDAKVKEKERRLGELEAQMLQQHDDMRQELAQLQRLLEQKRRDFKKEKDGVDAMKSIHDLADAVKKDKDKERRDSLGRKKTFVGLFSSKDPHPTSKESMA